jgi:hypothetical protein
MHDLTHQRCHHHQFREAVARCPECGKRWPDAPSAGDFSAGSALRSMPIGSSVRLALGRSLGLMGQD